MCKTSTKQLLVPEYDDKWQITNVRIKQKILDSRGLGCCLPNRALNYAYMYRNISSILSDFSFYKYI